MADPQHPESALPPAIGARFRIVGALGSGGCGTVYRALEPALDRAVALKLLHASAISDRESVGRFVNEARIAASLVHPGIVTLLDAGVDDGVPWITYELVEGRSLADVIAPPGLEIAQVVALGIQIGQALGFAHAKGVLHRDVKAENVFWLGKSAFKLGDFGVAKYAQSTTIQTGCGIVIGTPTHLAPEYLAGAPPSAQADLYALGVTLFHAATCRLPFEGESGLELIEQHLKARPPDPADLRRDLPDSLCRIISKALAKDPRQRHASADELVADLRKVRATTSRRVLSFGSDGVEVQTPVKSQVATAISRAKAGTTEQTRKLETRRAGRPLVAYVLGAALAVGCGWFALRRAEPPAPTPSVPSPVTSVRSPRPESPDGTVQERTDLAAIDEALTRLRAKSEELSSKHGQVVRDVLNLSSVSRITSARQSIVFIDSQVAEMIRGLTRQVKVAARLRSVRCRTWLRIELVCEEMRPWLRDLGPLSPRMSNSLVGPLAQAAVETPAGGCGPSCCREALVCFIQARLKPLELGYVELSGAEERAQQARLLLRGATALKEVPREDEAWFESLAARLRLLMGALGDVCRAADYSRRSGRPGYAGDVMSVRKALVEVGQVYMDRLVSFGRTGERDNVDLPGLLDNCHDLCQTPGVDPGLARTTRTQAQLVVRFLTPGSVPDTYRSVTIEAIRWVLTGPVDPEVARRCRELLDQLSR